VYLLLVVVPLHNIIDLTRVAIVWLHQISDTVTFGTNNKPAANWKVIELDSLPFFFAGFNESTSQTIIYGWCNAGTEGNDERVWCKDGNGRIRPYTASIPAPTMPSGQTFQTRKWESMQIGSQLYAVRIDAAARNTANVQILAISNK
jgi:hypothetical protein